MNLCFFAGPAYRGDLDSALAADPRVLLGDLEAQRPQRLLLEGAQRALQSEQQSPVFFFSNPRNSWLKLQELYRRSDFVCEGASRGTHRRGILGSAEGGHQQRGQGQDEQRHGRPWDSVTVKKGVSTLGRP